jgi:hypothetical protein
MILVEISSYYKSEFKGILMGYIDKLFKLSPYISEYLIYLYYMDLIWNWFKLYYQMDHNGYLIQNK